LAEGRSKSGLKTGFEIETEPEGVAMVKNISNQCWIDLYACAGFAGRLQRFYGQGKVKLPSQGSVIVGPGAKLVQADATRQVRLHPKQIVPDLADRRWKGKLKEVEVVAG
jgi:hypothetical protein